MVDMYKRMSCAGILLDTSLFTKCLPSILVIMTEITNNTADICSNIYKAASEGILPTSETLVLMSMRTDRRLILNAQVCHDVLKRGQIKSANQANAYLWMMLQPYLSMDALAIAMLTLQQIQAMTDIA